MSSGERDRGKCIRRTVDFHCLMPFSTTIVPFGLCGESFNDFFSAAAHLMKLSSIGGDSWMAEIADAIVAVVTVLFIVFVV